MQRVWCGRSTGGVNGDADDDCIEDLRLPNANQSEYVKGVHRWSSWCGRISTVKPQNLTFVSLELEMLKTVYKLEDKIMQT